MQRYTSHIKPKDSDGNEVDVEETDPVFINPHSEPCGGMAAGRVHFDAEAGSKIFVAFKTVHPDSKSNCTVSLGQGNQQQNYEALIPLDGSANSHGKFPCGREQSNYDGKTFKLPRNLTCDDCTIQMKFETKASGKHHMCSDIQILGGSVEDCSGQCVNGAVCMNGACHCRPGYQGNFCEIVEYTPVKTNYTEYLKFFLFFIIMILIIVILLFVAYKLFQNASQIREKAAGLFHREPVPQEEPDEDAIGGAGFAGQGSSNRAEHMQMFQD